MSYDDAINIQEFEKFTLTIYHEIERGNII